MGLFMVKSREIREEKELRGPLLLLGKSSTVTTDFPRPRVIGYRVRKTLPLPRGTGSFSRKDLGGDSFSGFTYYGLWVQVAESKNSGAPLIPEQSDKCLAWARDYFNDYSNVH